MVFSLLLKMRCNEFGYIEGIVNMSVQKCHVLSFLAVASLEAVAHLRKVNLKLQ